MGTRSIIVVTGKNRYGQDLTYRMYRHSDGYPSGALPVILAALKSSVAQCDETVRRYGYEAEHLPVAEQVVGNLIGAATDCYGMSVRIDDDDGKPAVFGKALGLDEFGNQADLEWVFVIDLNALAVRIYGGGYTGKIPQVAIERGPVDPISYANQLKTEYQESERATIRGLVAALAQVGFPVNPKPTKPKRRKAA